MSHDFDWIFFDCFNTLIDDFDPGGDESGLCSLPELAVTQGYFGGYPRHANPPFQPQSHATSYTAHAQSY